MATRLEGGDELKDGLLKRIAAMILSIGVIAGIIWAIYIDADMELFVILATMGTIAVTLVGWVFYQIFLGLFDAISSLFRKKEWYE